MQDDETSPLSHSDQQPFVDPSHTSNAAQNSAPLTSGASNNAKIFLPGQEAPTPTTYSDHTVPLSISPSPADASTLAVARSSIGQPQGPVPPR